MRRTVACVLTGLSTAATVGCRSVARAERATPVVAVASGVAGTNLDDWFHRALDTTDQLDSDEALAWFGPQFQGGGDPKPQWQLTVRPDASAGQRAHLQSRLAP